MHKSVEESILAYCGLECRVCPIHLATLEPDERKKKAMRSDIARECTERYGMKLQADDVGDCDGCRSMSGRIFGPCQACTVRQCAREHRVETCASCASFPCNKLQNVFSEDPGARLRLEALRTGGSAVV